MGPVRILVEFILLISLAAGQPSQQNTSEPAVQQPAATDQQLAAAEQLSRLLDRAVRRVLSGRAAAADSGQLQRLQQRLDLLELRMAAGQCQVRRPHVHLPYCPTEPELELEPESLPQPQEKTERKPGPEQEPESQPQPKTDPGPEPEPPCEQSPSPLPADQAPHQRPAVLACAGSCLQLRDQGGSPQDGVYWFTGMSVPVFCDFSHDGGGWTLLLTARRLEPAQRERPQGALPVPGGQLLDPAACRRRP